MAPCKAEAKILKALWSPYREGHSNFREIRLRNLVWSVLVITKILARAWSNMRRNVSFTALLMYRVWHFPIMWGASKHQNFRYFSCSFLALTCQVSNFPQCGGYIKAPAVLILLLLFLHLDGPSLTSSTLCGASKPENSGTSLALSSPRAKSHIFHNVGYIKAPEIFVLLLRIPFWSSCFYISLHTYTITNSKDQ